MGINNRISLPASLSAAVGAELGRWGENGFVGRLWLQDGTVWTGRDEGRWLGWLDVPARNGPMVDRLETFADRLVHDGFLYAALLGMGGPVLFPQMLRQMFGQRRGIDLQILDSTDPAQLTVFESGLDLRRTLFLVSSKSGTTLETQLFCRYFMAKLSDCVDPREVSSRFVAVTDAGSPLDQMATENGFRAVFHGDAEVGGRFSALSYFGMVPASIVGIDVGQMLDRARTMADGCKPKVAVSNNPGVKLGVVLGTAGRLGYDKVTLVTSSGLPGLGVWIEQVIAESTGKGGSGLIPIEGESLGSITDYGSDRLFVSIRLKDAIDVCQQEQLDRLEEAGHPVIRIELEDAYDIGAECFRWSFGTAVAGSILGVNPFNQPDVEASKVAARAVTNDYAAGRKTSKRQPVAVASHRSGNVSSYVSGIYGKELSRLLPRDAPIDKWLRAHFQQLRDRDYVSILAYLEYCEPYRRLLDRVRLRIREETDAATTVGFGPRYLHSTGQLHKGGPSNVLFLVVTCSDVVDVDVPGEVCSFGVVKDAQARGDEEVLAARQRRYLRLHLDGRIADGLSVVSTLVEVALVSDTDGVGLGDN